MNEIINDHLTEEQLMELVLGNDTDKYRTHLELCPECAREVSELRSIGNSLKSVDDEDVPTTVEHRIFKSVYDKNRSGIFKLLENPFLVTIITIIIVFLLYLMIGTLLMEQ